MSELATVERLENGDIEITTDSGIEIYKSIDDAKKAQDEYILDADEFDRLDAEHQENGNEFMTKSDEEKYCWACIANDIIEGLNEL